MNRRRSILSIAMAAALTLAVAACGDEEKVGSGVNDKGLEGQLNRIGESTTTEPTETTVPDQLGVTTTTTAAAAVTTTTAKATTTTALSGFAVGITGDKSGTTQFDPQQISVYVGGRVIFTNKDTVARSVQTASSTGAVKFNSGPIAPGGQYVYTATAAGEFPLVDGTRPYATATLFVTAR